MRRGVSEKSARFFGWRKNPPNRRPKRPRLSASCRASAGGAHLGPVQTGLLASLLIQEDQGAAPLDQSSETPVHLRGEDAADHATHFLHRHLGRQLIAVGASRGKGIVSFGCANEPGTP